MVTIYQDKMRTKLDKKIFNSASFSPKEVTVTKKTVPVYNEEDEIESYTESVTETIGVPYALVQGKYSPQPWGLVTEGESEIALRYSVDVDVEDIITIESIDYKVVELDPNYLPESVVKICLLSRIIN